MPLRRSQSDHLWPELQFQERIDEIPFGIDWVSPHIMFTLSPTGERANRTFQRNVRHPIGEINESRDEQLGPTFACNRVRLQNRFTFDNERLTVRAAVRSTGESSN